MDTGLLKNVRAIPETFTPNDDGRDDICEIYFNLDNTALVSLDIYDNNNDHITNICNKKQHGAGSNVIVWDGRKQLTVDSSQLTEDGEYIYKITSYFDTGIQSNTYTGNIYIDREAPVIVELTPANDARVATTMPTISAKIKAQGVAEVQTDIDEDRIQMKIDEYYVPVELAGSWKLEAGSKDYTLNANRYPLDVTVQFTPSTSLGVGQHIVVVYARDKTGNEAESHPLDSDGKQRYTYRK